MAFSYFISYAAAHVAPKSIIFGSDLFLEIQTNSRKKEKYIEAHRELSEKMDLKHWGLSHKTPKGADCLSDQGKAGAYNT